MRINPAPKARMDKPAWALSAVIALVGLAAAFGGCVRYLHVANVRVEAAVFQTVEAWVAHGARDKLVLRFVVSDSVPVFLDLREARLYLPRFGARAVLFEPVRKVIMVTREAVLHLRPAGEYPAPGTQVRRGGGRAAGNAAGGEHSVGGGPAGGVQPISSPFSGGAAGTLVALSELSEEQPVQRFRLILSACRGRLQAGGYRPSQCSSGDAGGWHRLIISGEIGATSVLEGSPAYGANQFRRPGPVPVEFEEAR